MPTKKRWKGDIENVENVALQDSSGSSLKRQYRSLSYRTPPTAASVLVVINIQKKRRKKKGKMKETKRKEEEI